MFRHFASSAVFALTLALLAPATQAQDIGPATDAAPLPPSTPELTSRAVDPEGADGNDDSAPRGAETEAEAMAKAMAEIEELRKDPEYQAEFQSRRAKFDQATDQLREALKVQRSMSIRYLNHEQRSQADRQAYYDQRQEVRRWLDETYAAALELARIGGDLESATYIATTVQHRLGQGIYDRETLEGATRMIDGGSRLTILFKAAARSAIVAGEFEMAQKLYAMVEDEQKEEIDRTLEFHLDSYRQAYEAEAKIREKEIAEDRLPRVKLETTQGDVVVELFLDHAPSTVVNFINLVEEGFYDGVDFYQVIENLMALTGDPTGLGSGNSGKFLLDEHAREDARMAFRGSLLMAKLSEGEAGKFVANSASSQFAILFLPVLSASENQTVFGQVIEGMEAVSRMRRIDPSKEKEKGEIVQPPDRIVRATVIRRPEQLPEPQYLQMPTR